MSGIIDTEDNKSYRKSCLKDAIEKIYQIEIKKKIESVQDFDEKNRIYNEYVSNLGVNELEDDVYNDFQDDDFMIKRQSLGELKKEGLNFESLTEVPTVIIGENEEELDKQNEDLARRKIVSDITYSDMAFVRITENFPRFGVVEVMDKYTGLEAMPMYFFEEEIKAINSKEDLSKYELLDFRSRGTVHGCINGLVSDVEGSVFSDREIMIVELDFENIIHNPGLMNLFEADTYLGNQEDDINKRFAFKLSKKAVILVSVEKYKELIQNPESKKMLKDLNICIYKGDKKIALHKLLVENGIVYGGISTQSYAMGNKDTMVKKYLEKLTEKLKIIVSDLNQKGRNVTYGTHWGSDSHTRDNKLEYKLEQENIERFIDFLVHNLKKNEPCIEASAEEILQIIKQKNELELDIDDIGANKKLKELIQEIGLDRLKQIVDEYNMVMRNLQQEYRKSRDNALIKQRLISQEEYDSIYNKNQDGQVLA